MVEDIIINKRKLNKLQRMFFCLSTETVLTILYSVYLMSIVLIVSFFIALLNLTQQSITIMLVIVLAFSIPLGMLLVKNTRLFMEDKDEFSKKYNNATDILSDSLIVNKEMVKDYLKMDFFMGSDWERVEIIKNSSGDKIFEELKQEELFDCIGVFNYMKKPPANMVHYVLEKHLDEHCSKIIKEPFTFATQEIKDLKDYYYLVSKTPVNKFTTKAVNNMNKEELISYLDDKVVERMVGEE